MSFFDDIKGTTIGSFLLAIGGVLLKNTSGNLVVRNPGDTADAEITASKINISGNSLVINSDATGAGNDYALTIQRNPSQTQAITYTMPPNDGSPLQVMATDGDGNLLWVSAASTNELIHVDTTSLSFGDGATVPMFTLPANAVIHETATKIVTPFNGTAPTMSIGTASLPSKYASSSNIGLKEAAGTVFYTHPSVTPSGTSEDLIISFVPSGATAGAAVIEVKYSIPT